MDKMLRYIFIFLLISPLALFGQKGKEVWRYEGPRIGVDLSRFLMSSVRDATKSAFEIQADMPYKGNYFFTVETGYQNSDDTKESFHYLNKGAYGRLGVDMNITKFEALSDNDLVYVGLRYGYSNFSQEVTTAGYSNYWGTLSTSFPRKNMNAHWAEILFGLKGELMRNIFIGWSVRAKFPLAITSDPHTKPYIVPGLGYTDSEVPFDFSFTVAYRFPLFKTKTLPKPIKSGGSKRRDTDRDDDPDNMDPNNPYGNGNGTNSGYGNGTNMRNNNQSF
ncbi:MAG: DUF6048 family protein [Marinilabiliales bacterium]|nr:DUF6048 family protein [Marinilabiliales bacterium]